MKNWLLFVFGPLLAIETCARVGAWVGSRAWAVNTAAVDRKGNKGENTVLTERETIHSHDHQYGRATTRGAPQQTHITNRERDP